MKRLSHAHQVETTAPAASKRCGPQWADRPSNPTIRPLSSRCANPGRREDAFDVRRRQTRQLAEPPDRNRDSLDQSALAGTQEVLLRSGKSLARAKHAPCEISQVHPTPEHDELRC